MLYLAATAAASRSHFLRSTVAQLQQALDEAKKRARADRFAAAPVDDEEAEKRRKRQMRFAPSEAAAAAAAAAPAASS